MDHLEFGKPITTEQHRDAVHVAVAPMEAGEILNPGSFVGILGGKVYLSSPHVPPDYTSIPCVGIVDPFLTRPVPAGAKFWLWLTPGSITSLRHEWEHPAFPSVESVDLKTVGERYLREFAVSKGISYEDLMETAKAYVGAGGDHCLTSSDYDVPKAFWVFFTAVTGIEVAESDETDYFSCSC